MGFSNPTVSPYFPDGVHSNPQGQYSLYRSYQGAILKALRFLVAPVYFELEPLLLWFYFIWGLVAPVYFEIEPLLLWLYFI